MAEIFISYRRADSGGHARNLYERLSARFGRGRVFLDVKGIRAGQQWRDHLNHQLERCRIVLAVIGPDWLNVRGEQGARRLSDPDDIVRLELIQATTAGKPVIPVLVGGASPPRADQVPEPLRGIVEDTQWIQLRHETFDADVAQLESDLQSALPDLQIMSAGDEPVFRQAKVFARAAGRAFITAFLLTWITNRYFAYRGIDALLAPELAVTLIVWFLVALTISWLSRRYKRHPHSEESA